MRKMNLDRLLRGWPDGIFVNPFEVGATGPELFRAACRMGLEGLVSKRRDRPYRAGRSKHWVKVENRRHPAMERVLEAFG
jgi:bifunctional non-homologous end joining protein LigD